MIKEARTKLKQRCSRPTVPESIPEVGENLKRRCFVVLEGQDLLFMQEKADDGKKATQGVSQHCEP